MRVAIVRIIISIRDRIRLVIITSYRVLIGCYILWCWRGPEKHISLF